MRSLFATIATLCLAGLTAGAVVVPAIAGPSRSAAAYITFGTRDADHGRWQGAQENFAYAVALDKHSVAAYLGLGRAYRHLGMIERSHAVFGEALKLDPHRSAAEYGWRETFAAQGYDAWFQQIATQASATPNDADLQTTYAEELLERGQNDAAVAAAQNALRLNPHESHARTVLGRIALSAGRDDEANTDLTEALRGDHTDAAALASMAELDRKRRDYPAAIEHCQEAVKAAPEHAAFYEELAAAQDAAGHTADAAATRATAASLQAPPPH